MTPEEKKAIEQNIMKLITELVSDNITSDAVLYIHADVENNQASLSASGDARFIANVIQHHIHTNPDFKRFLFAAIGAYLARNPDAKKEFDDGILLIRETFGIN